MTVGPEILFVFEIWRAFADKVVWVSYNFVRVWKLYFCKYRLGV